jgi:hypothetical protein
LKGVKKEILQKTLTINMISLRVSRLAARGVIFTYYFDVPISS